MQLDVLYTEPGCYILAKKDLDKYLCLFSLPQIFRNLDKYLLSIKEQKSAVCELKTPFKQNTQPRIILSQSASIYIICTGL